MDSSPLARLSPELRNTIYHHAFTTPYAVTLQPHHIQHPLTRACTQLRRESLSMFYALARFNAHLDDGPADPLARWLKTLGADRCVLLRELNVWDLHMLNATLYGEETAQEILRRGPEGVGEERGKRRYVLRPTPAQWLLGRGWYLSKIVIALYSMGLEVLNLGICGVGEEVGESSMTSNFAITRIADGKRGLSRREALWGLLLHVGFSEDMCREVVESLSALQSDCESGVHEIRLRRGRRDYILQCERWELVSIRQTYIPREEDFVF